MSFLRNTFTIAALSKVACGAQLIRPINAQTRSIKRWVAPTMHELRRRSIKMSEKQPPGPPARRSDYIDWNQRAELFAFGKRLREEFQLPLLQTAFTQRSYVLQEEQRQKDLGIEPTTESDALHLHDNAALAKSGERLAKEYVAAFLRHARPKLPAAGCAAFSEYLLNTAMLAHIGSHLGLKDLILSAAYPPTDDDLARSLLATIGALAESSGAQRAHLFVRDFICTQLSQRDPLDVWPIEEPVEMLRELCAAEGVAAPEPRLLGDCGRNTVLAAYHVGLYTAADDQGRRIMIGRGFGEDVDTAIRTASLDALHGIFGLRVTDRPIKFRIELNAELTAEVKEEGVEEAGQAPPQKLKAN